MNDERHLDRVRAMVAERRPDLAGDGVCLCAGTSLADLGVDATAAEIILPTYLRDHRRGSSQSAPVAEA